MLMLTSKQPVSESQMREALQPLGLGEIAIQKERQGQRS